MPIDIWDDLTNKLAHCQHRVDLVLMDDLNPRTQTLPDFLINIPVPPDHIDIATK